ncbi:protein translocase subunit SecF [Psychrobacter sp. HD31]|uniref:protein translocase subunit SecF n=1 Tax=Psychrobacter sp. HD31 TaxID=3112003 RepID=UPI003DA4BF4A
MTEENKNSGNAPTSTTVNNEQKTHRNRNKPRRNGKGSNVQANQVVSQNKSATNTTQVDEALLEQADEAAIAEGGVKAIGDKRIIDFMKIEKPMVIISGLLVLIALGAILFKGLNLGLDFTGGVSADVRYENPVEQTVVVQALADNGFDDSVVQYLGTRQELLVRLPPQDVDAEGLTERLNNALDINGNNADIESINIIGSQVGSEVYLNSLMAIGLALACMLVYVAVRFQFKLSVGAVLALFHDAIITIGVFALFGWPFDLTVLAAVLALIGYSLNDTIVVYDRIRENFRRIRGVGPRQVINVSLTETLRRTFMTSMTVLLVIWAMMFLGGDGLFWFSVALFIGMVAGTYSSVYIASAIPLMMGLTRDDFVVKVKPEFAEEVVSFNDPKALD